MSTLPTEVRTTLAGPAGALAAKIREPADDPAALAAVLMHPHPLYGGTMDNKTLFRAAKELASGPRVASLRFNFRGTGGSEGDHDGEAGEIADARCALDAAAARWPERALVAIGYSFGAAIGLRAAIEHPRVRAWVALGTPIAMGFDLEHFRARAQPLLLVQGEHDEFGPRAAIEEFAATLPSPVDVEVVPGADHLFHGLEDAAVSRIVGYIGRLLSPPH